jgi:hypothetical protein
MSDATTHLTSVLGFQPSSPSSLKRRHPRPPQAISASRAACSPGSRRPTAQGHRLSISAADPSVLDLYPLPCQHLGLRR